MGASIGIYLRPGAEHVGGQPGIQDFMKNFIKDLCDKKDITTGLEGKFSAYHAAAIVGRLEGDRFLARIGGTDTPQPSWVWAKALDQKVAVEDLATPSSGRPSTAASASAPFIASATA